MEEKTQPPAPLSRHGRSSWLQMLVFFTVFVVIVLGLLIGYRYAIDTRTNDWYLFHVARHTAWSLDKVGHVATLEDLSLPGHGAAAKRASIEAWDRGENAATPEAIAAVSRDALSPWESFRHRIGRMQGTHNPAEIRAMLAAWDRGESYPSQEDSQTVSSAPLSFWEQYRFRMKKSQRDGRTAGPRVWFVLRPGLETQARVANDRLRELRDSIEPGADPATPELEALESETKQIQTRLQELRKDPKASPDELGRHFVFIVVPECGAIEVMAIFFAAVIAFPTRWWKKLIGLLLGLPIMYFVNVFRLTCLAVVGAMDTTQDRWVFNFAHEYVWQTVYIVFVVAVWLVWIEYVVRRKA